VGPNTSGVFSLEELLALGQTGDTKADFLGASPDHIILPNDLPAGYYNLGGDTEGAFYVDIRSGSVPREFAEFFAAGKLKRDPFTNLPVNFLSANTPAAPQIDPRITAGFEEQLRLEAQGMTRQEAHDWRARQMAVPWINKPPSQAMDYSPGQSTGAYEKFLSLGGTDEFLGIQGIGGRADPMRDSLAFNFMQNAEKLQGLQANRAAKGLDPETGISQAEKKRIYDAYQSIADPKQRESFISQQDPGNLIPELREARYAARSGERELLAQNPQIIEYHTESDYSKKLEGKSKWVFESRAFEDPATGRERFVGKVFVSAEMLKPAKKKPVFDIMERFIKGSIGAGLVLSTGGGMAGAALGAYQGAGGWMPQIKGPAGMMLGTAIGYAMGSGLGSGARGAFALTSGLAAGGGISGMKKGRWDDFEGYGTWKAGLPTLPSGESVGIAIGFARFFGGYNTVR